MDVAGWCYKWDWLGLIAIVDKAGHMSVVKMKKRRGGSPEAEFCMKEPDKAEAPQAVALRFSEL